MGKKFEEFEARVRLNEETHGRTGELDILCKPPFDKAGINEITYDITFKGFGYEADKKSGWIPCSERLPEECEDVLAWIERDAWVEGNDYPIRKQEHNIGWHIEGRWHFDGLSHTAKCLAWMPLPEPYKRGEAE